MNVIKWFSTAFFISVSIFNVTIKDKTVRLTLLKGDATQKKTK